MKHALRRAALTAHVVAAVGWLGAVLVFLALGLVGVASDDPETVRGAYLVMKPAAWFVLVPLALASLLTGVLQALVSPWGLFRHYWVVFKLAITLLSTTLLALYMATFGAMAERASEETAPIESIRTASPVLHAAAAFVLLVTAAVLAVFKPSGLTRWGRRKRA